MHDVRDRPSRPRLLGKLEIWYIRIIVQTTLLRNYADAIIVHGSLLKTQLCSKKTNPNKVHIIPHFDYRYLLSTKSLLPPYDGEKLTDYVLLFGHIVPYKGIEVLINAARIIGLSKKNIDILIAGSGDISSIKKILTEEDRKHIFIWNEWIPSREVPSLLRRSRFLVLPYVDASQSGVLSLSYTFSKPVIVSRAGSLAEYVEHGKTGFVFDINDSEQLANYIIHLSEDEHLCNEMGTNAYQKVCNEMSLELCCTKINSIYSEIEHRKH